MKLSMITLSFLVIVCQGCSETDISESLLPADGKASLTGVVIDADRKPVEDILLFVQYLKVDASGQQRTPTDAYLETKTDKTGRFSFVDVDPGVIQFRLVPVSIPYDTTKYDLISVKIGGITQHIRNADDHSPFFFLPPDTLFEDIEIQVEARSLIRAQVVFKNGMPLANYPLIISIVYEYDLNPDTYGAYGSQSQFHTDIHGYITRYVSGPGYYTLSATYKGITAHSKRVLLNAGEHREDLMITFDSQPFPRGLTAKEGKLCQE